MIVFLDTNVYIAAKYQFSERYFNTLRSLLINGEVQVIYTSATKGEVEKHIRDDIAKAAGEYNRLLHKELSILPIASSSAITMIDEEVLIRNTLDEFNAFLSLEGVIQIDLNPLDAEKLMKDYFEGKPPFESKKPYEFKDAIMINAIKQYQRTVSEPIVIVSNDAGFRRAFEECPEITTVEYISNLLQLHASMKEQSEIDEFIEASVEDDAFADLIQNYLSGFDISRGYYGEWECDEHRIEVDEALMDYIEDENGKHLVHISLSLTIEADITHRDEDTSFYDREEQQYLIENFVKWREKHQVNMPITIACTVEKDESGEFIIGEAIIIDEDRFKTIDLDEDTLFDWDELDTQHREEPDLVFCSECGKVIGHAADYFDYDDNPICGDCMVGNSNGEICPACGRKVPTDLMVNGFCQDCAQEFD